MIKIEKNYPLQGLNTLGIAAKAHHYVQIQSVDQLQALLDHTPFHSQPQLILGGGSNLLLVQDFPGFVVHIAIGGIHIIKEEENTVWVQAGAGVLWHALVLYTLERGYGGIENLSLIPGTVGAAPIQNIGAYGVELKDILISLEAVEIATGNMIVFDKEQCGFGYRDSIFKRDLKPTFIILNITLKLTKTIHVLRLDYGTIRETLQAMGVQNPSMHAVSKAIIHIRQSKLPDPTLLGNAGSFFKNPIVDQTTFVRLKAIYPCIPSHSLGEGKVKLLAAWFIEQIGWKGKKIGNVGVCPTQPLILVNYGGATGEEIYHLAKKDTTRCI